MVRLLTRFIRKIKHIIITLRFSILSIFVTLFISAILLIIVINYFHISYTLLFTANRLMHEVSEQIYTQFDHEIEKVKQDSTFTANLISEAILNTNNVESVVKYTVDLVNKSYIVQSAYWSDEQGNMVLARYENNDSISTEIFNRHLTPPLELDIIRDSKQQLLKEIGTANLAFDPRNRPWYIAAKHSKSMIWTDIYLFKEKDHLGITLATPVYNASKQFKGVLGLDIRLDWLSWYLDQQKLTPHALLFITTHQGEVIALSKQPGQQNFTRLTDIHTLKDKQLTKAFYIYKQSSNTNFNFELYGKRYIAQFKPLKQITNNNWDIGIVVPQDDFISQLKINAAINILVSIVILTLAIFIISRLVNNIVYPIKRLTVKTEKIRQFELENFGILKSRIKEVAMISDAFNAMRIGLKSFQKYVPADLVRQLIEKGEDAVIGGSKKNITVFFSDIEKFTTLAETMDPNLLMEQTCEYFDALSKILIDEHATIDKYIGDSIMAFWGAPIPVTNPCYKAAYAALKCKSRLNELNQQWIQVGKPALHTRIGIHTGEAIVGNVGSSERLNYTALGDTVNVASRLEHINKLYHTQIIVSEDIYVNIKNDFILKYIDSITLRGRKVACNIYELIGMIS